MECAELSALSNKRSTRSLPLPVLTSSFDTDFMPSCVVNASLLSSSPMRFRTQFAACLIVLLHVVPYTAQDKPFQIGEIEFFGSHGLDIAAIRKSLPLSEGSNVSDAQLKHVREIISSAVTRSSGLVPTDVVAVCCDNHGDVMIFIGLPGSSFRNFRLNAAPRGSAHLPREIISLSQEVNDLTAEAIRIQPAEDDSNGYALSLYGPLRTKQLAVREWALDHAVLLRRVLATSTDPHERSVAASALGYARQSKEQIAALTKASRDPDEGVRNEATRALAVLAGSNPQAAKKIPAAGFVDMVSSGIWLDRNKAARLLSFLTRGRDQKLLKLLRARALDSLIEMAIWRSPTHADSSLVILGRIAGMEEDRLQQLVAARQTQVIFDSVRATR